MNDNFFFVLFIYTYWVLIFWIFEFKIVPVLKSQFDSRAKGFFFYKYIAHLRWKIKREFRASYSKITSIDGLRNSSPDSVTITCVENVFFLLYFTVENFNRKTVEKIVKHVKYVITGCGFLWIFSSLPQKSNTFCWTLFWS